MAAVTEVFVHRAGPTGVGDWVVGVVSYQPDPPRVRLVIGGDGPDRDVWVELGGTFPVGADTWRFEDIRFEGGPSQFVVTLRVVPPGAPPFAPPPQEGDRVWTPAPLRHPGPVDEIEIIRLEAEFGQRLPTTFRHWLARTNGAVPQELVALPGTLFAIGPLQPLMGIHDGPPGLSLRAGRERGAGLFTAEYVVVAATMTGLLAVRVAAPEADLVVGLSNLDRDRGHVEFAARGYATPADYICRELLVRLAPDIATFEAGLQPLPPMAPTTFTAPPPPLTG